MMFTITTSVSGSSVKLSMNFLHQSQRFQRSHQNFSRTSSPKPSFWGGYFPFSARWKDFSMKSKECMTRGASSGCILTIIITNLATSCSHITFAFFSVKQPLHHHLKSNFHHENCYHCPSSASSSSPSAPHRCTLKEAKIWREAMVDKMSCLLSDCNQPINPFTIPSSTKVSVPQLINVLCWDDGDVV